MVTSARGGRSRDVSRWVAQAPPRPFKASHEPLAVLTSVSQVVVTYGAHGARWFTADRDERASSPAVECLDSTGAGDAFNAGLLASWLTDGDPVRALAAGVASGSAAAAGLGARPPRAPATTP